MAPPGGVEEKSEGKGEGVGMRILFLILLVDLLAFTSILPLFPAILEHYAEAGHRDAFYTALDGLLSSFRHAIGAPDARFNSVFFGGLLGSLFSLLQFVSSPVAGALSDVYGRKKVLLVAVSGSLASYALWSQAATFSVFLLSRVVGGVAKASVSIATVIVADIYSLKNRSKGMAAVGVAFSVGFLIGPSIGAYFAKSARDAGIGNDPFAMPAYFSISLTVLELLLIAFCLPETLPPKVRKTSVAQVYNGALEYINPRSLFSFSTLKSKLSAPDVSRLSSLGGIYFLYLFIYSGLEFTLSFFTRQAFAWDSRQQAQMYFFGGAIMILVQGGYVRRLSPGSERRAVLVGLGLLIPAFLLVAVASSEGVFYAGLSLYSVASGIVVPCVTTLAAAVGSPADKGAVLGTFRSLGALARAAGPLLAAAVFWAAGPVWCYGLGAAALLLPLFLFARRRV